MSKTDQDRKVKDTKLKKFNDIWKSATPLVLAGILLLGAAGFAGYSLWQQQSINAGGENSLKRDAKQR